MSVAPEQPKRRGRPPRLDPADRAEVITMRVSGAERRAKLRRLGRAWLERAIDEATEPPTAPGKR